jgi:class 3 adenylate cyclase
MKLMPKRVYSLLQANLNASPYDTYPKTTILFADICGFTIWAKKKSPKDVVGMLSTLYSAFDCLTVKHKVYKVHTIGDCYVVLGLDDYLKDQRDHDSECLNVVNMAIDMIREIKRLNEEVQNLDIGMRIGIHTGTIIGGFVGKIVVRYDIFGPAVTKANKMESGGAKNNINVSEKTHLMLSSACPDRFHFIPNDKEILYEPKSKRLQGYYLDPINSEDFF